VVHVEQGADELVVEVESLLHGHSVHFPEGGRRHHISEDEGHHTRRTLLRLKDFGRGRCGRLSLKHSLGHL